MIVSDAKIKSSQTNGAKSQGPLTPETRAISAKNSLKHGLTGKLTSEADLAEIDRRAEALTADLKPCSAAGVFLISQMAMLSVRADRAARHESAMIAKNVRHAAAEFDEERRDRADDLFDALGEDPRKNLRKLRKMPEGVERLIDGWRDLRNDLGMDPKPRWTASQLVQAASMLGIKEEHARGSRIGELSRAFWDDIDAPTGAKASRVKTALFEFIDAQIAELEAHHETLDFESIELDRAEAGDRALFDASKEATLARRYEAEARRGFSKALKEFRIVEAEAAANAQPAPTASQAPTTPEPGSFRENPPALPPRPAWDVLDVPIVEFPGGLDFEGQPKSIGRRE